MRVRIIFSKNESMRFTGHLDLFRALERTIRRAKLPLTYSQGFNPHPKISLASALPLGFTSSGEVADFWLNNDIPLIEINKKLIDSLPPGIEIHEISNPDAQEPKVQNSLLSAKYTATLQEPFPNLQKEIDNLLNSEEVIIEKIKKGKKRLINIREFVHEIKILDNDAEGNQIVYLHLSAEEGKTGRPDVIFQGLGLDPLTVSFNRDKLFFK